MILTSEYKENVNVLYTHMVTTFTTATSYLNLVC